MNRYARIYARRTRHAVANTYPQSNSKFGAAAAPQGTKIKGEPENKYSRNRAIMLTNRPSGANNNEYQRRRVQLHIDALTHTRNAKWRRQQNRRKWG